VNLATNVDFAEPLKQKSVAVQLRFFHQKVNAGQFENFRMESL
jgi:hypothetical protein